MIKNYLKTAFRNLKREKGSALINIAGLTIGIACSLVLFLMIQHFTSYDVHESKRDRIYRIVTESDGNRGKNHTPGVPTVFTDAFRNDFPEAEEVLFLSYRSGSLISIPQPNGEAKKYSEESGVVFTEPNYFKVFDRPILLGDAAKGLDEPNEAILSKEWALKYFGKEDAVGEVLRYDKREYKITAVMENLPKATDFPFNLLLSYSTIKKEHEVHGWGSVWSDEQCYFLLKEGERISKVESRLPAFLEKYVGKENTNHKVYSAQAMKDFHYDDRYETFSYDAVSPGLLISLGTIAVILLITACINFINLATAEAIKRSKEVGIRKSLGSTRIQLVRQFLGETVFVTVIAVIMSLGLTQVALSFLNPFLKLNLSLDFAGNAYLWGYVIGVTVFVALLSGVYPAFVISGFNPALALKNLISNKNSSGYNLRRSLVVVQFCISQLFIIGTIVVINQMNYFQQKDLGFRQDAIITVPIPEEENPGQAGATSKMRTLRDELARSAGVEMASLSSTPPSSGSVSSTGFIFDGESDQDRREAQVKTVDGNYIDLYDLKLIAGTGLQDLDTANGFVVNERLTKVAGVTNPADIVGKVIRVWGRSLPVVGVVKDFHTVALHRPMEATVLFNRLDNYYTLSLKINMAQSKEVIDNLKTKWETTYPEHIFEYQFLDESIRRFYEGEKKMSILLTIFSSMAIFIGCLGLFGLATFMANQKTKEVGVRKVLGASVESIVFLFSREYIKLILIGFVLAAPVAWFLMNQFLNEFEYKIDIGADTFLIALGASLLVAMLTVGYKSFRAAIANPVKSLRSE